MTLMALMAYQCQYVIGDMMALSYFLAGSGILAVIGNMIAPIVSEKLGGRKKSVMISAILGAVCYAAVVFVGKSLWGFVIATCIGYFFIAITDTLSPVMFGDAGEYYLHKEGKDTRAYMLSMSGLAGKAGFSLSTLALGAVLGLIAYDPGTVMTAEHANMLNLATGGIPAICYIVYVVILLFHGVSDKEIEQCIEENAQKYGEMPE
jgi:GPH family glycoside/pentoside/hexuronide:cation symporter